MKLYHRTKSLMREVVEEPPCSGFHGSEPGSIRFLSLKVLCSHFSPSAWKASAYHGPLSTRNIGLFVHVSRLFLGRLPHALCSSAMKPIRREAHMYPLYSSPNIAPLAVSLNLSLVNGYHPPRPSLNVNRYLLQLLNTKPHSLILHGTTSKRRLRARARLTRRFRIWATRLLK